MVCVILGSCQWHERLESIGNKTIFAGLMWGVAVPVQVTLLGAGVPLADYLRVLFANSLNN